MFIYFGQMQKILGKPPSVRNQLLSMFPSEDAYLSEGI